MGLKFSNINWKENCISLSQQKTGNALSLPLSKELGMAIISYLQDGRPQSSSAFIFLSHNAPFQPLGEHNNFNPEFHKYLRRAGIAIPTKRHTGVHTIRHSFATNMLRKGTPVQDVSQILGHSNISVTETYLRVDIEHFEQRTFKDYYNRMLQDAGIGHFTFHALRHTFATRALERGMDYKTLSAILGHYSVSFTMDTYVHSMDEHKRNEMDKMDDLFGISLEISVEQQPYPVLFTVTEEGCKAFAPDFPKIQIQAGTMETALMEAKKQIQKALSQFKYPPIPTRQEDIVVPENSVLILLKTA